MQIDYQHLYRWMKQHGITYKLLAENAHPAKISYQTISKRMQAGEWLPSDVILNWAKYYNWTAYEMNLFCLNGHLEKLKPLHEYSVLELNQEIFRRCTA